MDIISPEQCHKRMGVDNPWWSGSSPRVGSFYRGMRHRAHFRRFATFVEERGVRRAVVLMGPRRVGKTVVLQQMIQRLLSAGTEPRSIAFLSLDQPLYTGLSIEDIAEHVREVTGWAADKPSFLFLDEIQYLRDWERHLKAFVDANPLVKCVASGSAAAALRLKSIESGAGRFSDFLLPPLTFYEYLDLQSLQESVVSGSGYCKDVNKLNRHFLEYINFGGFPEAVFSDAVRNDIEHYIRNDILDKVLLRDLPSLYGIQDTQELNRVFIALALHTAQEVSLEKLSQRSGATKPTLKRYIEYLEAAFLIKTVRRVDESARHFKRANFFKVYLTNPSVHCALFGPVSADDPGMGALTETAVFAQWFHSGFPIHYARWKSGEVDLVRLHNNLRPVACVEIKWSDNDPVQWQKRGPLKAFAARHPGMAVTVTTRTASGTLDIPGVTSACYKPASLYSYQLSKGVISDRMSGMILRDADSDVKPPALIDE